MSVLDDVVSTATSTASSFPWGAAVAGGLSYLGQSSANQSNQDIAQANNAWSAQQFATRYQTTVKDLEAAGLNPMMAYSQGAGNPPTAQQVQFQNALGAGVNSGLAGYTKHAELDQIKAQTGLTDDQADKTRQEKKTSAALEKTTQSQQRLNDANVLKTIQDIKTGQANANAANASAAQMIQDTRMKKLEADWGDKLGIGLKAGTSALNSAFSTLGRFVGKPEAATINKTFNYGKK